MILRGPDAELIALGPAFPISRRSHMGVPVGVRANLALAVARGGYDVVHGFEPGLPSLSSLALRDAQELAVASFFSPDRLGYPPGRAQRERLLARVDALVASSPEVAAAAELRFPGDYRLLSPGVDVERFRPARKARRIVVEWRPAERALARTYLHALEELPGWELVLLRTKPLTSRPYVPRRLRGRVHVRTALDAETRAEALDPAA